MSPKRFTDRYGLALVAYAISVAAILIASFYPEARLWGFNRLGFFDLPGDAARLLFLVIAVIVPLGLMRLSDSKLSDIEEPTDARTYFVLSGLIILVFVTGFYLLRARTHFLGDGYLLLIRLAEGTHPIRPWNPAVYWIQDSLNQLLGATGEDSALATFRLISIGSGLALLVATALAAARLYRPLASRLLFLLGVATGGYALVFFGHVENYPMFVLAVGLFGLLGVLSAKGKVGRWWLLLPLVVALPLHPFGVAMIPAAIYLLAQGTGPGNWIGSRPLWLKLLALAVLSGLAGYAFYHAYTTNYFFRFSIVPFDTNRFTVEGYSMFSGKHLLDYLNLLGLLLPGLLLGGILMYWARSLLRKPAYLFLMLFAAASLGIAFLFDPKLGMPRDWDMFSFVGIPLTLLMLTAALDRPVRSIATLRTAGLAIALGLLILIPRAVTQASPDIAINLFDRYAELDLFKNGSGRFLLLRYLESRGDKAEADRRRTTNAPMARFEFSDRRAQTLMRNGDIPGAMNVYHRMLGEYPGYHNAWTNLGICHYQLRQYDSAVTCLRISDGLNPFSINVYHYLALSLYASGFDQEAEERWLEAMQLVPDDYRPYTYLLLMYDYSNRTEEYTALTDRVLATANKPDAKVGFVGKSVELYLIRGDLPAAQRQARRALQMGIGATYICDLQERYPTLQLIECAAD